MLVYQSDVLTENVTIAGPVAPSLFVSSSGTDSDWIVKLIDVCPEGTPGIATALTELGSSLNDVVRTRMFITSPADAEAVGKVHRELFDKIRPAATMVVVAGLLDPRWRVEIEAEAVVDRP